MEHTNRDTASNAAPQEDWRDAAPIEGTSLTDEFVSDESSRYDKEEEETRFYASANHDDPDPDDEDEDDEDEDEDEEGDWGHVDPAEGNGPFPDSNDPSGPGSAV